MKISARASRVLFSVLAIFGFASAQAQNINPDAFAGPDKAIASPATSITLSGFGSDPDGNVASYSWSKVSGGSATIATPGAVTTNITGLSAGNYIFQLSVTDDSGGVSSDSVQVFVHATAGKVVLLTATGPGQIYRPDLSSFNILPGDTIEIPAGSYPVGIQLGNFTGSASNPVKIINGGGLVLAKSLGIGNAKYFKVSGSGSADPYGFKLGNHPLTAGLSVGKGTSDYEIERVEVENSSVGLFCKIQPVAGEPNTYYPNWVIRNVYLHDNYVHTTGNEGLYIGHTFPNADKYSDYLPPARMENVKIYNNTIIETGWDGMQLSNARDGNEIFNNTVTNFGTAGQGAQQAGIQLGGNTTGKVYANTIHTGTGPGLTAYGYGDVYISKNVVTKVSPAATPAQDAVYISSGLNTIETNPGLRLHFLSNTIVEPKHTAIRNQNLNGNELAGEIRLNKILDPTGRTAAQLIYSYASDVISGNTVFTGTPTVTIQTPEGSSYSTNSSTLAISGIAADDGGVTLVTWTNEQSGGTGNALGTSAWSVSGIPLVQGLNQIQIKAQDSVGNFGTATVVVTYMPPAGAIVAAYNAGSLSSFTSVDDPTVTYAPVPYTGPLVTGGNSATLNPTVLVSNTQDDTIFQSSRWGTHTWNISGLDPGEYQVRLRFMAASGDTAGSRRFDIAMEGTTVRSNFDIRSNPATAINTARDEYQNVVVTDGVLNIKFTDIPLSGAAKVNAIEVRSVQQAGLGDVGLDGSALGSGSSGSSNILPNGDWEITGSGGALGGNAESGWFEKLSQLGNFRAIVKVKSFTGGSTARAGLMVREDTGAGARMSFIGVSPATNYITATRSTVNQAATVAQSGATYSYPDAWLMIARQGNEVSVAGSSDGTTFSSIGTTTLSSLTSSLSLGLYVTSGGGSTALAVFSEFAVEPLAVAAYDCGKTTAGNFISLDDGITSYAPILNATGLISGGGSATINPTVAITDTDDDVLFQSYHYGTHSWTIPVPAAGTYTVTLRFVANSGDTVTSRVFDVAMEGETVLPSYDIRQAAGALNKAIDEDIDIIVNDGVLNIQFTTIAGNAKINAIRVVPKP